MVGHKFKTGDKVSFVWGGSHTEIEATIDDIVENQQGEPVAVCVWKNKDGAVKSTHRKLDHISLISSAHH